VAMCRVSDVLELEGPRDIRSFVGIGFLTESPRVVDDPEDREPPALFSFLDFLPLRENMDPRICTLSGLSDRVEGILLEFDRFDDFRDRPPCSDDPEEKVPALELLPKMELLFICSV